MDKTDLQRNVESLRHQLNIERVSVSQTTTEMKKFIESTQEQDPLVVPIDKRFNPWAEKSKCSIL